MTTVRVPVPVAARARHSRNPITPLEETVSTPESAGVIVCYSTCWSCKFGHRYDPPQRHPWWDAEDVEAAAAVGSPAPEGDCACPCARPAVILGGAS